MTDYEELLGTGSGKILDFLKNDPLFESQFRYTPFNSECYEKMYRCNFQDNIKTVRELQQEISELKTTCGACREFFARPESSRAGNYNAALNRILEDVIIEFLKAKYKLNVTRGDAAGKKYPDCMLLSGDKGILAYFEIKYHGAPFLTERRGKNRECYEGGAALDLGETVRQIELIEAELDRPVFYLHWIDYPCLKGIFFETSEQIKEELFVRAEQLEGEEYPANLLEMGSFEELIKIFLSMKKHGVVMN